MFAPLVAKPKSTGPQRAKAVDQTRTPRRDIGYQATTRFVTPQSSRTGDAPGARTTASTDASQGTAPSWDFSKIPVFPPGHAERSQPPPLAPLPRLSIQAKLAVGSTDDPLEHEADRVADQVMRIPAPVVATTAAPPQVSRKCAACEEEERLQKKQAGPQVAASEAPASVNEALRSPGQPLDAATRAYFEQRFGRDFSHVRVHTDASAAQSARDVDALAYTVGRDVVFAPNQFTSATKAGRLLLAHELAHVVQQHAAKAVGALTIQEASDPAERAAGHAADSLSRSEPIGPSLSPGSMSLQRDNGGGASVIPVEVPAEKRSEQLAAAYRRAGYKN